jgi:hypothetical protein
MQYIDAMFPGQLALALFLSIQVPAELWMSVQQALQNSDVFAAVQLLAVPNDVRATAERYSSVARDLFRRGSDVRSMIAIAQQGIGYCLSRAVDVEATDPALAANLRSTAKVLAYNLGADTWPGWSDPAVRLTEADMTVGYDAAKLNLRLAIELARGLDSMTNAWWLVGAHQLARGETGDALESFEKAKTFALEGKNRGNELLMDGYSAIARMAGGVNGIDKENTSRDFSRASEALIREQVADGQFLADQLKTAHQLFVRR